MAKSDFGHKQPAPQGNDNLMDPRKSGTPSTGFGDAPQNKQDRGGPGPGVPPSKNKIK